jgi:hypothetical protein
MKVYNPQRSPLIYGDSKTIDAHSWAEGTQAEFQELIDNNLVIVKEPKVKPVEKPVETIETSVEEKTSEVEETLVVSEPSIPEKQDTIKKVKRRSVPTKE